MTIEAQRALHDRANLQHQLAFTLSRVNAEREAREDREPSQAVVRSGGGEDKELVEEDERSGSTASGACSGDLDSSDCKEKSRGELEELKWKKETSEMEAGKLRGELEMICRDRDDAKSSLNDKMLEIVEAKAKCLSLKEQRDESEKKLAAAVEAGECGET